ncbi:MAG: STAS-like domain-containing protein [Acidobacteria bacterium]|nr:STAS-like domain-containing protein [Acidobacteriota bacterium]
MSLHLDSSRPLAEAGGAFALRLREESAGFGSRLAGRQLRTKCLNLLNAEPAKPLLLDWTGVPLVSSSFADELVGKLFASLGPLAFSARVRNVGMDATVRGLVDKAIMERAAQVVNGAAVDRDVR